MHSHAGAWEREKKEGREIRRFDSVAKILSRDFPELLQFILEEYQVEAGQRINQQLQGLGIRKDKQQLQGLGITRDKPSNNYRD